jgi:copper chaperone CopZ
MHCEGCVRRVAQALNEAGVVKVNSVEVGSASVTINPARVSHQQIRAALAKLGFTAHVAGAAAGR